MSRLDYLSLIPQELITEIFISLPTKSLGRCKCVSKLWNFLISDPHFIKTHLTCKTSITKLIVLSTTPFLYSVDFDNNNIGFVSRLKLNLSNEWSRVWGSCNGLILVEDKATRMFLLNPTTLESKRLPHLSCEFEEAASFVFGFGYDVSRDDYVIVALSYSKYSFKPDACVYVYALETYWQWRKVGVFPYYHNYRRDSCPTYSKIPSAGIFLGGRLHWLAKKVNDSSWVIAAFNIANEEFIDVPMPNELFGLNLTNPRLGLLKSRLCLITFVDYTTQLWVMKEYGVVASWIKLSDVLSDTTYYGYMSSIHDVSLKMLEDSLVLLESNQSFLWVSSEATESRWFRYMKFHGSGDYFKVEMTYVDSLVSLKYNNDNKKKSTSSKKKRRRSSKKKRGRISKSSIQTLK